MNYKQNLHTHTTYVDGRDTPEELIKEALARGFDSLGFSEHTYLCHSTYPNQLTAEKESLYRTEIAALKEKYRGKIGIFCGLETHYYSDVDITPYDYIIGSVHYLDCGEGIYTFDSNPARTTDYINRYFDGDGLRFAKKYFETISSYPERRKVDILGHFDLIAKNNDTCRFFDEGCKEYLNLGYAAIHALRGHVPLFEVNTGAVAAGYRQIPYPQLAFLKEFKACGFGAVITSDCHNKNFLDCHFEESRALLAEAGFTTRFVLTDNGFEEIAL
ncbi:MAG: PHP domain-containing protein [Clostridia bacterium]|nr:PHP domain-containing protein [Clostridia bacterium]